MTAASGPSGPAGAPDPEADRTVRQRVWSGGPWEQAFGYCRAVRAGDRVCVAGSTAAGDPQALAHGDAAAQARVAFATALEALLRLGGGPADVVRTRMYAVDRADCDAIGAVHGELFGGHPPAATMLLVAGLIDPMMRVEVELEAVLG